MIQVPISKKALSWAIETSGIPKERIDAYFQFPQGTIDNWIVGKGKPNQTQFNALKAKLKRPAAVFFMEDPPQTSELSVELRSALGKSSRTLLPNERRSIRDAIRMQKFVGALQVDLGYKMESYPDNSTNESPEDVAHHIRKKYFGVSLSTQMSWKTSTNAFRHWRRMTELMGVLVFLYPIGKKDRKLTDEDSSEDSDDTTADDAIRGFSNVSAIPPVIGINTAWSNAVRCYTLFHELGHLLTRTSSACVEVYDDPVKERVSDQIERWCEQFAASFLMPREEFETFNSKIIEPDPIKKAGRIANKLFVSRKASLIRLIEIGEAKWQDYKYLKLRYDRKPTGGRPDPDNIRNRSILRKDQYGSCLSIIHEAYNAGIINESDIREYVRLSPDELK